MPLEFSSAVAQPGRILPSARPRHRRREAAGWKMEAAVASMIAGGTRALTGLQVRWLGCKPGRARRIYFANHTSHLDFVIVWAALPPWLRMMTRPVAGGDYWRDGLRRYLAERVFRSVFVERNCPDRSDNPVAPVLQALDHGDSIILFPEGTRGTGEELLPFKSGIFHIVSQLPGMELVPVWMGNACRVLPKGAFLPLPLICSVTFGAPTMIERNEEKTAFLSRLRQSLLELQRQ